MDITFNCPSCGQELEVDATGAGTGIECPACSAEIMVPVPEGTNGGTIPRATTVTLASAPIKEEKHFAVPTHHATTDTLIQKPNRPLEVAAKDSDKKVRIKTFKHTECQEVGKDRFDEIVSNFLDKVGWANVISVTPINYSFVQLDSHAVVTDFGVLVVFRG